MEEGDTMKQLGVLSSLSELFDPAEIRQAKQLKKQWDDLDDIATIIQVKDKIRPAQHKEEDESDKLRDEMNMLLERVACDTNRIKEIINQLLPNNYSPAS